jgi:hypothetical protein
MNDEERGLIDAWVEKLTAQLKLEGTPFDIDEILGLAGVAARTVVGPAAPLTTFIVGYAAGRTAAAGADPERAMRQNVAAALASAQPRKAQTARVSRRCKTSRHACRGCRASCDGSAVRSTDRPGSAR